MELELSHWQGTLTKCGVIRRTGKDKSFHFRLTSYKHSDLYVNMRKLESYPRVFMLAVANLITVAKRSLHMQMSFDKAENTWFIGPEKGGMMLAYECARQLLTRAGYVEKDGCLMKMKSFDIQAGNPVYVVDDVLTTGGSVAKTIDAVRKVGGIVQSPILVLCNRSSLDSIEGIPVVPLITLHGHVWEGVSCPLCKQGSELIEKPKES